MAYRPELDGRGSGLGPSFVQSLKTHSGRIYDCAYEWCAGPAFIGFAMVAEGVCNKLVLSDINPAGKACVDKTLQVNDLDVDVAYYVSDNMKAVPEFEKFDLVVSNPPNFYALNPDHSRYDEFEDDFRPNDPEWVIHKAFYSTIRPYLNPGADLYISEVEPEKDIVYFPKTEAEPFDVRPRPALDDFIGMIRDAGLEYRETIPFYVGKDSAELHQMISRNTGA